MAVSRIRNKRKQASQSDFEVIWPGVKRCLDCGYALAHEGHSENETALERIAVDERNRIEASAHSTYHGKFFKAQREYGESNVLLYKDLREMSGHITERLFSLKENDFYADLEKLSVCYEEAYTFLRNFRKWYKGFSKNESEYLKGDIEVFSECDKIIKKSRLTYTDVDSIESLNGLSEISKQYRKIKDRLELMKMGKRAHVVKDYDSISFPAFLNDLDGYISDIDAIVQKILVKNNKTLSVLTDYFRIEYTKSLRLWDMCKLHPKFEDYCSLLWNTPKFQNFIRGFLTNNQLEHFIQSNLANRRLVDFHFNEAPFYFGGVEDTGLKVSENVKDFSYMERLIMAGEIDDGSDMDDIEDIEDLEKVEKTMTQLGKLLSKH